MKLDMKRRLALLACGLLLGPTTLLAENAVVATFSIVARDPETGAMGCAVQSRYFAVGAVVPWGEADIGVFVGCGSETNNRNPWQACSVCSPRPWFPSDVGALYDCSRIRSGLLPG